jgi:hypothetical protein
MKFVLKHFYAQLEEQYTSFTNFIEDWETARAALEVYQEIAKRSPMDWLGRNHYQYVSKHEGLMIYDEPRAPMGPFPYTQIRSYYPREGVVLCQWKLGDDGLNEIVVHDQVFGGKRVVNPIVTMDVHRHYRLEQIRTLEQIVDEKVNNPMFDFSPMAKLIRSFYKTRSEEIFRQMYGHK